MNIQFPVKKRPKYGIKVLPDNTLKEELISYEMWATGLVRRDGVNNILLDIESPWRNLWETAYKTQNFNKDLDLDVYWISKISQEDIGWWEGFVTSFVWQGIKFVDVFVQLVIEQKYYLPKVLIKQIKDKIDAKLSKIDASSWTENEDTMITWQKPTNSSKGYFNNHELDNFGKIN